MSQKLTLALALAAGLLGGLLSHHLTLTSVFAQTTAPIVGETRAQSFVVVDGKNNVVGRFTSSFQTRGQSPTIVLLDAEGHELWRGNGASVRPLGTR